MTPVTEADRAFLQSFEEATLAKSCWNHAAHVRMAWLVLELEGNYESALARIRRSIGRYNEAIGTIGYHETMTVAFTRLIDHRRRQEPLGQSFATFAERHVDLLSREPSILARYYGAEDLGSPHAKTTFVSPTLRPLPPLGTIRPVRLDDVAAMRRIYAPFVESTAISFETAPPSEEDFAARVEKVTAAYPWLVFDSPEGLAGYAYASRHRERAAYQWTVEVSIYVDPARHREGVARALYRRLFAELEVRGFRMALAGVALPNEASVRLHESMGFEPVGVYRDIGYKLGRWHDVGWWQKRLSCEGVPVAVTRAEFDRT